MGFCELDWFHRICFTFLMGSEIWLIRLSDEVRDSLLGNYSWFGCIITDWRSNSWWPPILGHPRTCRTTKSMDESVCFWISSTTNRYAFGLFSKVIFSSPLLFFGFVDSSRYAVGFIFWISVYQYSSVHLCINR